MLSVLNESSITTNITPLFAGQLQNSAYAITDESPEKQHCRHEYYSAQAISDKAPPLFISSEVASYVNDNQDLENVIAQGIVNAWKIFGESIGFMLELDCDIEDGTESLFLIIKSPFDAQEARKLLRKLREEWFFTIFDTLGGRFHVVEEPM